MKKLSLILLIVILGGLLLFSFVQPAQAGLVPCGLQQDDLKQDGDQTVPCQLCHTFVLFNNVVDFLLFRIIPPLAVLMLVIGGFMYIFSYFGPAQVIPGGGKGGPAMLGQAKKLIFSVVIGIVIMFGAWAIVNTFFQAIGVEEWTGLKTWWEIKGCPSNITAPPAPATTPPPTTPATTTKACYCYHNDCWQKAEGCDNVFKSLCQPKQVPVSTSCIGEPPSSTPPPTTATPPTAATKICYCSGEKCYRTNSTFPGGCRWRNRNCQPKEVPANVSCSAL